ncbi:MAG: 2-oxoglutarate and iron-dependent oxygenase domain-containing protein, partial [Emcibacteraceae bacterium]|nr:2-oxoglutarate and iron-dependent oxygenase domain-containing protein [Emcibacteraceae bacterium]
DGSNVKSVADALREASQDLGFIYIKGHGIPEKSINAARKAAYNFFRSTSEQKEQIKVSPNHRGWIGTGGAKMDDDAKPDLKESFLWGFEDESGNTLDDHELRGANLWPDFQPNLERYAQDYFDKAHEVAHHLMRGFAIGLNLDENFFLKTSDKPLSRGSFVYYPSQSKELGKDQFGVAPHTDFGVLTVLCQDNVGGLQVETANGEWIDAPPIEGTLIVNVADLLHRWTDGAFKSTPHRVINNSGRERLSIVLAFDPNPETMIDARDIFKKSSQEAISCGDYLNWRFNKAFSYRKEAS